MEKVTKYDLTIISKPHAHAHTMKKTHAKFQNCKKSCAHKTPMVNVDEWTNGRKLACLSRPAKAGATKREIQVVRVRNL